MTSEIEERGAGRPKAIIDWKKVGEWLMMGCNGLQAAARLGICYDALVRRCLSDNNMLFSEFIQEHRSKGESVLHQTQFEVAVKNKNVQMLLHLGKHRLGQKDKEEFDVESLIKIIDARNNSPSQVQVPSLPGPSVDGN